MMGFKSRMDCELSNDQNMQIYMSPVGPIPTHDANWVRS